MPQAYKGDIEHQTVDARRSRFGEIDNASIGIGDAPPGLVPALSGYEDIQCDGHAGGRRASGDVEHVGGDHLSDSKRFQVALGLFFRNALRLEFRASTARKQLGSSFRSPPALTEGEQNANIGCGCVSRHRAHGRRESPAGG